jgi:hypothetical protein
MMNAASPLWWQRFDAERQERRVQDATPTLRGDPALDTYGEQVALIAHDLLALARVAAASAARI